MGHHDCKYCGMGIEACLCTSGIVKGEEVLLRAPQEWDKTRLKMIKNLNKEIKELETLLDIKKSALELIEKDKRIIFAGMTEKELDDNGISITIDGVTYGRQQ